MAESLKVYVVEFGDRRHYQMQYVDPVTGRKKTRSTGVVRTGRKKDRTEAERVAAKWEAELREGRYCAPSKITWAQFRERYEMEVLPGLAKRTDAMVGTVFNAVERILGPTKLADITAERISQFQATLRQEKKSEATIRTYLAHLRSSLNWAVEIGFLTAAPKISRPPRATANRFMKGRPITLEEFERICSHAAEVVGDVPARSWTFLLYGLWWSGLRLSEALDLWWDRDDRLCIKLDGKRPMLSIPGELEKGNRDRLLPMSPEFARLLETIPATGRKGRVFKLINRRGKPTMPQAGRASKLISQMGRRARIIVHTHTRSGKTKHASAHDLRRSFGERWSKRVMPQVLKELMCHESIETTQRYYVGQNSESTADVVWSSFEKAMEGNSLANSDLFGEIQVESESTETDSRQGFSNYPLKDSNLQPSD